MRGPRSETAEEGAADGERRYEGGSGGRGLAGAAAGGADRDAGAGGVVCLRGDGGRPGHRCSGARAGRRQAVAGGLGRQRGRAPLQPAGSAQTLRAGPGPRHGVAGGDGWAARARPGATAAVGPPRDGGALPGSGGGGGHGPPAGAAARRGGRGVAQGMGSPGVGGPRGVVAARPPGSRGAPARGVRGHRRHGRLGAEGRPGPAAAHGRARPLPALVLRAGAHGRLGQDWVAAVALQALRRQEGFRRVPERAALRDLLRALGEWQAVRAAG